MRNSAQDGTGRTRENLVNAMTGHDLPGAMRASDADRDSVVADLGEHFQAGRLTAAELDERTGRALTARTYGELTALLADLPAVRPASPIPAASSPSARPSRSLGRVTPPVMAALTGLVITALVLVAAHAGWGLIWLLVPALLIARRSICSSGASGRYGQKD
jgi:Domain of unknown function (DUF1707)